MAFPSPAQGLVVRYSYLWLDEYRQGREEGIKDRPCAVILVTRLPDESQLVTVLPITHAPPNNPALAVEIPQRTKERLGLDAERSWIILTESNRFIWPGPDLRPRQALPSTSVDYGFLPFKLSEQVRLEFIALLKEQRTKPVMRTV